MYSNVTLESLIWNILQNSVYLTYSWSVFLLLFRLAYYNSCSYFYVVASLALSHDLSRGNHQELLELNRRYGRRQLWDESRDAVILNRASFSEEAEVRTSRPTCEMTSTDLYYPFIGHSWVRLAAVWFWNEHFIVGHRTPRGIWECIFPLYNVFKTRNVNESVLLCKGLLLAHCVFCSERVSLRLTL